MRNHIRRQEVVRLVKGGDEVVDSSNSEEGETILL